MLRYASLHQTGTPVGKFYFKSLSMIPLIAPTQVPSQSFIFHLARAHTHTQEQTDTHTHSEIDIYKDNLNFSKHTIHPFILLDFRTCCSFHQDQFHLILQDQAQMPLLISPRFYYTLNSNCLLTYVTNLEFYLKDKNVLFTFIPLFPL